MKYVLVLVFVIFSVITLYQLTYKESNPNTLSTKNENHEPILDVIEMQSSNTDEPQEIKISENKKEMINSLKSRNVEDHYISKLDRDVIDNEKNISEKSMIQNELKILRNLRMKDKSHYKVYDDAPE